MMTFNRRKQPAPPLSVTDPAILIRINRLYRDGMTEDELYDATRSCWKLGSRRNRAKYALAVFEGVVQEVYEIDGWHEGGTTPCKSGIQSGAYLNCDREVRTRRPGKAGTIIGQLPV